MYLPINMSTLLRPLKVTIDSDPIGFLLFVSHFFVRLLSNVSFY